MSNPAALRRILRRIACGPQLPRMAARPERKLTRRRYSRQSGRSAHSRACHEMSCSVMRCREPPCSAEFQFGFGQRRQASRLHPLPLPLRRPVHPDAASHRELTTLPPGSPPHCRAPKVEERLSLEEAGRRLPRISISRPSSSSARAFGKGPQAADPGHVMKCHVLSCDVMFFRRPAPLRLPRRSAACLHPACRPSIAFRCVRAAAGLPAARPCFARIAREPRARLAFRAPARFARLIARANRCAGRTSPVRSVGVFSRRHEAGDEAASGCRFLLSHLTTDL